MLENAVFIKCSNCDYWEDESKIYGKCRLAGCAYNGSPTRYDFRCPNHPKLGVYYPSIAVVD